MRSIYDNVAIDGLTGPQLNTTPALVITGTVVDTKGYNSAVLRIFTVPKTGIGPTVANSITAVLQECATSTGTFTTATDVSGATIGTTIASTATAVIGSARIEGLGQNRLRYLRIQTTGKVIAGAGTADGSFTSVAVIELGRGYARPVTATVSNT